VISKSSYKKSLSMNYSRAKRYAEKNDEKELVKTPEFYQSRREFNYRSKVYKNEKAKQDFEKMLKAGLKK